MTAQKSVPDHQIMEDMNRLAGDAAAYGMDAFQRSLIFLDILRQRGNDYLEIVKKGQPPVLTFKYEIIMDGRSLDRPVNHDLARIIPGNGPDKGAEKGISIDPGLRPVVVIDPRAGHGPGIGGSKRDSQIGMAMRMGHPVYFILFYPDPEPGQAYEDVKAAQTRFIEEVKKRHPESEDPVVIGNCQAGWSLALLSADRPDVTGPIVINGSPMSYWAGVEGKNPMRYRGGVNGGIWLTSLLCDLGNGKFDGANLVMNFEDLNPANTYWTKQYNVWANADTEEQRFLNFEKWWNSYFMMTAKEIRFILQNLFVGNRLESGRLELDGGKHINLKNLKDPVVVFASGGDNITPPQQALNWIAKVYGSVDEIRRCGQAIVYRVHDNVGHLGIFVSGSVARKEHKEIIENVERLDYLPPGLYEMVLEEKTRVVKGDGYQLDLPDYYVHYKERDISDILAMDDGVEDENAFEVVARVSEANDRLYQLLISPWVRMMTTETSAEFLRQLHPMRSSRYFFADGNPVMPLVEKAAGWARSQRRTADADNPFITLQQGISESVIATLNAYRDIRDATHEFLFYAIYDNPFMRNLFAAKPEGADKKAEQVKKDASAEIQADRNRWMDLMEKGGVMEGYARVIRAMVGADRVWDEREFETVKGFILTDFRFKKVPTDEIKRIAKEQSRILQTNWEKALSALPKLLPEAEDRSRAYDLAVKIADADLVLAQEETVLLGKLRTILGVAGEKPEPEKKKTVSAEAGMKTPNSDSPAERWIAEMKKRADSDALKGMARFGINTDRALGLSMGELSRLAKEIGKDHETALALWDSGIHEARILAAMITPPKQVTEAQMEAWAAAVDSWDLCDQCCSKLFVKTPFAWGRAAAWARREEEFVKRAGFVLMAQLAVHDKKADDELFMPFFDLIRAESVDDRNLVKKAVNWALRQIGKRSLKLNAEAVDVAKVLEKSEIKSAAWIGRDALKELTGEKVKDRLKG